MRKVVLITVFLVGYAFVIAQNKHKITIITGNPKTTVFLDEDEFGTGDTIQGFIKENYFRQIVIETEGHKDCYAVIKPRSRKAGVWFAPVGSKLISKAPEDKNIVLSKISLDIANRDKDIYEVEIPDSEDQWEENMHPKFNELEWKKEDEDIRLKEKAEKLKSNKNILQDEANKSLIYDNTRFSKDVYTYLKRAGFIDTISALSDNNNTLFLEGSIRKIHIFHGYFYYVAKLHLTWYIKNAYSEILDSVDTYEFSGEFVSGISDEIVKVLQDAVSISYFNLHENDLLQKHIKQNTDFDIPYPGLILKAPSAVVADKAEAGNASVIVKTVNGHGSGFAITNDGYIVTNYHVLAGEIADHPHDAKIVTYSGEELDGKVVRYNKFRDVALIKVDKQFDKAFKISSSKSFKNMQTVYTIGAPKSIELGQSTSRGVISNERKTNNNNLLQLGMSINGGNSGGPLFDDAGNLHGVIVSKLVGQNTEGISFAVPGYLLEDYLKINFK